MAKATRGPWKAVPRHTYNDGTQDEMDGLGWDVEGPPTPLLRGMVSKATDAWLIASAPLLLEACQQIVSLRQGWWADDGSWSEGCCVCGSYTANTHGAPYGKEVCPVTAAQEAIAKAVGDG